MIAQFLAAAAGFNADQLYFFVSDEIVKDPDRIRPTTDAGNYGSWKFPFRLHNLRASLTADDFMEVADHRRIGMRAEHAAQQVMRRADVGDPVAHGFVDCIFQCPRASIHAANFRAQQPHAEDVEFLTAHVFGAHVNHTVKAEQRTNRRRSDAVLTGPGFSDHAVFPHPLDEQGLAEAVVDLVRAGVQQVLALQVDFCTANFFGESPGEKQRSWAPGEGLQEFAQSRFESRIAFGAFVFTLELFERGHEGLRNVTPTPRAEAAGAGDEL